MARADADVVVVGAGPYGLSLAAHLGPLGVDHRVFGSPMHTWRTAMPQGMHLKSDGFASSLSDPDGALTLGRYCSDHGLRYADLGEPVPLETFVAYGLAFQQRFVPDLDERHVTRVARVGQRFSLELDDGTEVSARRVVLAVGITSFAHLPEELSGLPEELCTHSSAYGGLGHLAGARVAVVGAGASALDLAALLRGAGTDVSVVTRGTDVHFHDKMRLPRPLRERILAPTSGVGPGWRSRFYTDAAPLFHRLPERVRLDVVARSLGPVGCWFVRDEVVGHVRILGSRTIAGAAPAGNHVRLDLRDERGEIESFEFDHVIAATGYRIDMGRLALIDPALNSQVVTVARTPVLSAHFESSVRGLYFVGATAANSFGPVLRFAYGAAFASRRLARHLARPTAR